MAALPDPQPHTLWQPHPDPIIGLAPMNAVTDHAYRFIQKKYGRPAVIFTEFTSVEGICAGATRLLRDFLFDESQRPIVAQIFGHTPAYFYQAAIVLCELGFDGIDINMGCPAPKIADRGSGAALIRTPDLAQAIVRATQAGVRDWQNGADLAACPDVTAAIAAAVRTRRARLPAAYQQRRPVPVSVKTRIGYDRPIIDQWLPALLMCEPAAICFHGRTLTQMYQGRADWVQIARAVALRGGAKTLILGNGDVRNRDDVRARIAETGVDGVLIGRASYGNPFIFRSDGKGPENFAHPELGPGSGRQPDAPPHFAGPRYSILNIMLEHCFLFEESFSGFPGYRFAGMRKQIGWYVSGLPGARRLKRALLHASCVEDVVAILHDYRDYRLTRDKGLRTALADAAAGADAHQPQNEQQGIPVTAPPAQDNWRGGGQQC